jgi:hypothetical protein
MFVASGRRVVVVRTRNFQSPAARGSGTKRKIFKVPPRVVVVRSRNRARFSLVLYYIMDIPPPGGCAAR